MKMTREWRPLLLLRPRLVDHRGHIQGSGGVGLVVRKGVIGPIQEFQGACECSEGDSGGWTEGCRESGFSGPRGHFGEGVQAAWCDGV